MATRNSSRSGQVLLFAAMTASGAVAAADASPVPEEFLEYLGSWESDDADWLVASAAAPPPATTERKP